MNENDEQLIATVKQTQSMSNKSLIELGFLALQSDVASVSVGVDIWYSMF